MGLRPLPQATVRLTAMAPAPFILETALFLAMALHRYTQETQHFLAMAGVVSGQATAFFAIR
jgi:hypothetical protein